MVRGDIEVQIRVSCLRVVTPSDTVFLPLAIPLPPPSATYIMQSKAYLSVFGLSFAGGLLAPRSSSATRTITWTSRIPNSPILHSLSGLLLVLVSLFALTYLLISGFTFVSGDVKRSWALGRAARRVSRHVLKAVLFERACFLLRRAATGSSTHLQDLLDVPGAVEQFDFWVSCSVYYLAFLGLETVWGQVLPRAKARDDWNATKASQVRSPWS